MYPPTLWPTIHPIYSPPLPLPYRPQSAGPILRPNYSAYHHHRLTTGSHNNLRDFMRTTTTTTTGPKPGSLSGSTTIPTAGAPFAASGLVSSSAMAHPPHRLSNSVYGRIETTNIQVIKSLPIPNISQKTICRGWTLSWKRRRSNTRTVSNSSSATTRKTRAERPFLE